MDSTALWAFIQQKTHSVLYVVVALFIFIAGWQMGRVMSPYYASHPIVFQDVACPQPVAGGAGTAAALADLQEQGRDLRAAQQSPAAQVAGIQEKVESPAPLLTQPVTQQEFVASVNSTLYHHKSCATVSRIKEENKRWFASAQEAEDAGFKPSKCALEIQGK